MLKAVVNEILRVLPILGESGSEVSCFIPEPRNFAEVTRLSEDIRKTWLKITLKEDKNIIKNQNFLAQDSEKGEPMTPFMNVYKNGSLEQIKLRIIVRRYLQNKELVGDNWSPTASMRNLK